MIPTLTAICFEGILSATLEGGFLLVHSIPRFPLLGAGMRKEDYGKGDYLGIDSPQRANAQGALCVNLGPDDVSSTLQLVKKAGVQVFKNHPLSGISSWYSLDASP